jgi:hypothetical protein
MTGDAATGYDGEIVEPDECGNPMVLINGLAYPKVIPDGTYYSMTGGKEPVVGDIVRVLISNWTNGIIIVKAP